LSGANAEIIKVMRLPIATIYFLVWISVGMTLQVNSSADGSDTQFSNADKKLLDKQPYQKINQAFLSSLFLQRIY
jgi:hypothetical protein